MLICPHSFIHTHTHTHPETCTYTHLGTCTRNAIMPPTAPPHCTSNCCCLSASLTPSPPPPSSPISCIVFSPSFLPSSISGSCLSMSQRCRCHNSSAGRTAGEEKREDFLEERRSFLASQYLTEKQPTG